VAEDKVPEREENKKWRRKVIEISTIISGYCNVGTVIKPLLDSTTLSITVTFSYLFDDNHLFDNSLESSQF
jgi:hypothetical protein